MEIMYEFWRAQKEKICNVILETMELVHQKMYVKVTEFVNIAVNVFKMLEVAVTYRHTYVIQ